MGGGGSDSGKLRSAEGRMLDAKVVRAHWGSVPVSHQVFVTEGCWQT